MWDYPRTNKHVFNKWQNEASSVIFAPYFFESLIYLYIKYIDTKIIKNNQKYIHIINPYNKRC